ncbi:MAG: beta-ketoacyl-[acyl-carrier-protein] synthase II [Sandaracinus sp.]|nr:beta-ketoacyl-[acyl-carrier-protein] synthase II [Sandaracinus sp.]
MSTQRPRLPLTAHGLACGLGLSSTESLAALERGERGLREVPFEVPFATVTGTLPGGEPPPVPAHLAVYDSRLARLAHLAWVDMQAAGERAIARWGAERVALIVGTSTGGIGETEAAHEAWWPTQEPAAVPASYSYPTQHSFHAFLDFLAELTGIAGPRYVVSTACSSSNKVFASARRLIELGIVDAAVVGGVDGLCHTTVRGFHGLGVMAPEPCRPFGVDRPGMNVGEAAALVLVEREGEPLAWLRGVGETSDAYHPSSPDPEGRGALRAMQGALAEAGVAPGEVDHVNAHGTGTQYNDIAESKAIAALLGTEVPVVSTKAYTGHTLGACGGVEAIFAIHCLRRGWIPAALGAHPTDPDIPLRLPAEPEERTLRYVLSNSFAFGGNNCSVLFEAAR